MGEIWICLWWTLWARVYEASDILAPVEALASAQTSDEGWLPQSVMKPKEMERCERNALFWTWGCCHFHRAFWRWEMVLSPILTRIRCLLLCDGTRPSLSQHRKISQVITFCLSILLLLLRRLLNGADTKKNIGKDDSFAPHKCHWLFFFWRGMPCFGILGLTSAWVKIRPQLAVKVIILLDHRILTLAFFKKHFSLSLFFKSMVDPWTITRVWTTWSTALFL